MHTAVPPLVPAQGFKCQAQARGGRRGGLHSLAARVSVCGSLPGLRGGRVSAADRRRHSAPVFCFAASKIKPTVIKNGRGTEVTCEHPRAVPQTEARLPNGQVLFLVQL